MSSVSSLITTGLLCACAFAVGCRQSISAASPVQPAGKPLVVQRGEFLHEFILTGELDAEESVVISVPRIPTWETTIKWLAEDGTLVRRGDKVAELDNSAFVTELERQREAVRQARSELAQLEAKSAIDQAQQRFETDRAENDLRKARLRAAIPPDILSQREHKEAQLALQAADVRHANAEELLRAMSTAQASDRRNLLLALETAERELARSEAAISELVVLAPSDGIIIIENQPWEGRKLQVGDRVWVGFNVARIPDLSSMQVVANLWDVDDGRISVGDSAGVVIDAYPQRVNAGTVSFVAPVAQEVDRISNRRALRTIIDLDQSDPDRMRPGLSVRVTVLVQRQPDALLVARAAVDWEGDPPTARTRDREVRVLRLGPCNASVCVVEDGVVEGDELVVATLPGAGR